MGNGQFLPVARGKAASIEAADQKPEDAATAVVGDVEIWVCGVVDLEREKAKLQSQLQKLCGQIEGIERKLQNESFVEKAPPEVVARERERREDLARQRTTVEASLAQL